MRQWKAGGFSLALFCAVMFAATVVSSAALAQTPASARIGTASLISPSAAATYYALTPNTTGAPVSPANIHTISGTPAEITELARALRNDPDLIYDYVRNTIEVTWIYGLQRGSLGAVIDRSGTPFDQAKLMVDLLLAAGHTSARYRMGTITLDGTQFASWTNITSATAACQLLSSGGIPAVINGTTTADCNYGSATVSSVQLAHIWVSVSIDGTTYYFDPSYKPHTFNAGVSNLNSAAGLTAGVPLSTASSGMNTGTASTVTYAQQLNGASLDSLVQGYAATLQTYIQTNMPAGDIEDVVGGRDITRSESAVRNTSYGDAGASTLTAIPNAYRTMLGLVIKHQYDGSGTPWEMFNYTFYVDEIYGRRSSSTTISPAPPRGPTSQTLWPRFVC